MNSLIDRFNEPSYRKAVKIVASCETPEHFEMAWKFYELLKKKVESDPTCIESQDFTNIFCTFFVHKMKEMKTSIDQIAINC